jgi:hypothetical protein
MVRAAVMADGRPAPLPPTTTAARTYNNQPYNRPPLQRPHLFLITSLPQKFLSMEIHLYLPFQWKSIYNDRQQKKVYSSSN